VLIGSTDADTGLRERGRGRRRRRAAGPTACGSEDALGQVRAIEARYAAAGERRSVTLST
jgi:hypothetical protein